MKSLHELIDIRDSAWPLLQEWQAAASNVVELLPPSSNAGDVLVEVQVTTHSLLGAVAFHTGGVLVDSGWLRLLGSGHPRLQRSLPSWNNGRTLGPGAPPVGYYLVADDAVGGVFALNGGGLGTDRGNVYFHAPDTLAWEPLDRGYTDFINWCFNGDLADYYDSYRWSGWQSEVSDLPGDQSIFVYPPLFAAGPPVAERHRGRVPVAELYGMYVVDWPEQLRTSGDVSANPSLQRTPPG